MRILLLLLFISTAGFSQTITYHISFENAVHHEAVVSVTFPKITQDTLTVRMSRTSPGRYALHEFAKNVYAVKATDSKGQPVKINREDPYSWQVSGHDGTVNLEYTLFGNRADGTYSQIDQTHAHLNIPATFMYSEDLKSRPIEVNFDLTSHPEWKISTQLKQLNGNTFFAPDLYYFMDSPTEISEFELKEFELNGQNIRFALHHLGTKEEVAGYFEKVKKIVKAEMEVYGELPQFDYGEYTFIACYMPNASGDGMEHRNSTVLTSTRSLSEGGMEKNIGTVSHEFFHAWNVERIRPKALEPFDFTEANMSGELWFAEGFTSYYTNLILTRAGLITAEEYINRLNGTFNYVWNSPATKYFNPIEMSYQAPFVDAATSVDPVNRENTFISYYSYGSMLGLALDLKLREKGLNLDDYMKLVWTTYGKQEKPYTLDDLEQSLGQYAGKDFSSAFFGNYIYDSQMPDYEKLLNSVGLKLERGSEKAFFGPSVVEDAEGIYISGNPAENSPAYKAGLDTGDRIISVNGSKISTAADWEKVLEFNVDHKLELEVERIGNRSKKTIRLEKDPTYLISIDENASSKTITKRMEWLGAEKTE